jgi:hypothetical protein
MRITRPIDHAQVDAIAQLPATPPVARNLWITQAYHELSKQLAAVLGDTNANWCTFGTWGSMSVGAVIRGDEGPRSWLLRGMQRVIRDYDELVATVTAALSEGNRAVFAAIAPAVLDFLGRFEDGKPPSKGSMEDFLGALPPSLDPEGASGLPSGAEYAQAFRYYHAALTEKDPRARAEAIFGGNLVLAYNEQLRLQPTIAASYTALPQHLRALLRAEARWGLASLPGVRVLTQFWLDAVEYTWTRIATERLLSLTLAQGEVVYPGNDVPRLPGRATRFPPALATFGRDDVTALWAVCNRAGEDGAGSGVNSWVPFEERMSWIGNWFRSRQQYRPLFSPPFTDVELARLERGDTSWIGPGGVRPQLSRRASRRTAASRHGRRTATSAATGARTTSSNASRPKR